jgi:hypothetical protein
MSDNSVIWLLLFSVILAAFLLGGLVSYYTGGKYESLATETQQVESFQCYSGKGCSALIKEADQSSHWVWLEIVHEK